MPSIAQHMHGEPARVVAVQGLRRALCAGQRGGSVPGVAAPSQRDPSRRVAVQSWGLVLCQ